MPIWGDLGYCTCANISGAVNLKFYYMKAHAWRHFHDPLTILKLKIDCVSISFVRQIVTSSSLLLRIPKGSMMRGTRLLRGMMVPRVLVLYCIVEGGNSSRQWLFCTV